MRLNRWVVMLALVCLWGCSSVQAVDYLVSGAGTSAANGTYVYVTRMVG
jgi:uncharacterized protein YceK